MTVQSIDKRVVPEANMTPLSLDKQQESVSAEDAFLSVLQQTTQRFAGKNGSLGGLISGDKVLSEHITRLHMDVKVDAKDARQDAQPDAKDARPLLKADKPRAAGAATARKGDDAQAAPAPVQKDDDAPATVQAADSDASAQNAPTADDDTVQAPVETKAKDDEQIIVSLDVTITETVQIVQVADTKADNGPALDLNAMAQTISAQLASADDGKPEADPMAGLSAADRQRITDLENRLVNDVQDGNLDDALDAATELVNQMITKVGQHKAAAEASITDQTDSLADEQARDLAAMLAGSNVHLDIKVQTTTVDTTPAAQTAATMVDTLSLQDLAAQAVNGQGSGQEQAQGQGFASSQDSGAAVEQTPATVTLDTNAAATGEAEASPFAAILAAQVEASAADEAAPEQRTVVGLAGVGSAQAADKASGGQAAQSAARTPRTLLQAQVMEQVTVQIDKQVKDGADTIKIQLKPYELGKIEIKLEVSADGHVSATVTADKPETLAMLQKDAKGLEKALEDAGLKPDSAATTFSLKGGEQQQNADRGNNNTRSRRGRNRAAAGGDEAQLAGAGAAQAARSRTLGGRSGVDISV
ncbi:flagellar hook-length control protein FliK [Paramagnetospirillum magneticum]|uniref:Flagellar hook-length control protein n=1 Tax=Paramagnetospirillum magneticum (strain ATCC 700264 / AMB-1) TaxID=342108 RepID=Q2WA15_PARM1|nr:flagellar hook-length control protein FliK [Paramagnetospirillum magneticum]BAE49310.1 Flagellar hook-length control protein [Paramagnetospirillum magneticum AMB-1]